VETERARFVLEAELSDLSFAELCRRHGISRPTGYKWLERYEGQGVDGLGDRSRRPHSCPHATPQHVVDRILEVRKRRGWGARKICGVLAKDPAVDPVPTVDTIHRVLDRNGHIDHRKPRRRRTHPGPPLPIPEEPNSTWTADFKGEFRTGDGHLCFPLTVQDGYTRFLLDCRGMLRLDLQATMRRFRHLFREVGLPERIRTDNGHPFASTAIAGLSQLSVWWISIGILPELIEPGKPQQNGRHERMHRTLKEDAASPPRADLRAQQARFNGFRRVFNHERPHEALAMQTPSDLYHPSPRTYTEHPQPLEYPAHYELRLVSQDASIRWHSRKVFVSSLLGRRWVGLEQVGDGVWSVYFGPVHLGWLDEADFRIMDVKERTKRRR
jgi:transposase InsO family protein